MLKVILNQRLDSLHFVKIDDMSTGNAGEGAGNVRKKGRNVIIFIFQRAEMNLSPLQAEVRLKRDIRACKTIVIIIATNFFAHVPAILFAVVDLENRSSAQSWLAFFAVYILYLSSALNPIIYCVRNSRLQSALRQFLKDPLGSRDFRENAVITINARTMSNDDGIVGTRDRVEHACASELDLLGDQTRRNISNDQKDEEIILSINRIPIEAWSQINGNNTEHRGCRMPRPEVPSTPNSCLEEEKLKGNRKTWTRKKQSVKDPNGLKRAIPSSGSSLERKVLTHVITDLKVSTEPVVVNLS